MKRRLLSLFLFSGFFLCPFSATSAVAQKQSEDCGCNAALGKDTISIIHTVKQQFAFLSMIDEHTFYEYKSNLSLIATIPIAKELVKLSSNYEDFQTRRTDFFRKTDYTSIKDEEYRQLQIVTSALAYPAWSSCMNLCAKTRTTGLFAYKDQEDKESIVCTLYYHGAPNATAATVDDQLIGGQVPGSPNGHVFPARTKIASNGSLQKIILREGARGVKASFGAAGYTADPVASKYEDLVSSNQATLRVERPTFEESAEAPLCKKSAWSANNNSRPCAVSGCSPDGAFETSTLEIIVQAAPDHVLRAPKFTRCWSKEGFILREQEGGTPCQPDWTKLNGPFLSDDQKVAIGVVTTWTWPTMRELCVDHIRLQKQTAKQTKSVPIPETGSFSFSVASGEAAVLEYVIRGKNGVLNPGDKQSADGLLDRVGEPIKLETGTTFYHYQVK